MAKKELVEAVKLPEGKMCSGNCVGCIYWNAYKKDGNGRQYCNYYDKYWYPSERSGCLSRKS